MDVDTDFARDLREEVIDYTRLKYGIDKVGRIVTYSQIKAKSGLKMYLRTLGINMSLQTKISEFITADESLKNFIDEDSKFYNTLLVEAMEDASEINKELKAQYTKNNIPMEFQKTLQEIVDDVIKLEKNIVAIGQHACGVVISSEPLNKLMPTIQLKNPKYDKYDLGVQFAKEEVEEIGCLKMDFLGLKTLDILQNTLNRINAKSGKNLTLNDLNIYDKKIYKILAEQESFGIFQFEGEGMIGFLSKYLNKNKEAVTGEKMFDVAAASTAAYRPGPMSELPGFLKSLDEKKWHYPNEYWKDNQAYNEILAPTDGLLLYQEQTMRIVREIAGFTPGEADDFRKVVGKKLVDKIPVIKAKFIEEGSKLGHPEDALKDLWNNMEAFGSYGFNKSHAVAYTYISMMCAYLATYYPTEFYAETLNFTAKDEMIPAIFKVQKLGMNILPADLNKSDRDFTPISKNNITFGLSYIKNLGSFADVIISERVNKPFKDFFDFYTRTLKQGLSKSHLDCLIKSGSVESLGYTREYLIPRIPNMLKLNKTINNQDGESYLLSNKNLVKALLDTDLEHISLSSKDKLIYEKDYMYFYISGHPIKDVYYKENNVNIHIEDLTIKEIDEDEAVLNEDGEVIEVAEINEAEVRVEPGVVKLIALPAEVKQTKSGKAYWVTLEDKTGVFNALMNLKTAEEHLDTLKNNPHTPFIVKGDYTISDEGKPMLFLKDVIGIKANREQEKYNKLAQEKRA